MTETKIWDPVVRVFHWSLVIGFTANALILDDEDKVHELVGYAVVGLIALRLVWGLIGTRHARFRDFPPSLSAALGQVGDVATGRVHVHRGHTPLGALMIYNLLLTILLIGASGWMMTTTMFWGVDWVEELHEGLVTWAEISILLHIAAVIFESWRTGVNLPRSMITGRKRLPTSGDGA
ncbi:cytochrome b/b6 domain-containing protein [Pseudooceanicola atlanticus]|uniref:Cytochrome B n=1 Tax=Pseudooceanicola atlanticus TaxID=1461694 RepID=A0A0A0E9S6_9RHOB|nr:cytochrome b/b6 domain-containing protein [Pseudooceanicola atlanticus]KGM46813.1 cytochrome B [Pseudooceanicola atlanticus]